MPIVSVVQQFEENADSLPVRPTEERREIKSDEIALLDLLIRIAERKRLVLWLTCGSAVLSLIASFILPQRFTATVTLLPPQQSSPMGAAFASQLAGMGGMAALAGGAFGLRSPNEMYVSMLRSRVVEDAMVQRFGLLDEYGKHYPTDARKAFERRTEINGNGKDGLIHISIEDHDPRRASELANGYVEEFRKLSQHIAITEASQRRLFFDQELAHAKDNLTNAEEALKRTEMTSGVIQLDSQARALIETGAAIRAQIAAREVQIQGMQTYAANENAQLNQAKSELEGLRAQLAKLESAQSDDGLLVNKGRIPEAGLEYYRRLRDVKYNETIFDVLARQYEMAKLDEAKEGAVIQVVDPAVPPDKRSFPKRILIIFFSTIAGFLIGVLSALFSSAYERLLENSEAAMKINRIRMALRPGG